MTAPMTVAEIAVRLAAGMAASGRGVNWSYAIQEAAEGYEALLASGHIAPEPEPVAGPDWDRYPWANYIVTTPSGTQWFHENEPLLEDDGWVVTGKCVAATVHRDNWRESLQRRPGGG